MLKGEKKEQKGSKMVLGEPRFCENTDNTNNNNQQQNKTKQNSHKY